MPAAQQQGAADYFPGDFLEYWVSARLLVTGQNPYSPEQQLVLQRAVIANTNKPLIMWNPPWTLFLLLPFGLLSFWVAYTLWSMLILACLLFCSAHLWRIYGGPVNRYWIAWLTCFSVVPTYLTLYVKQIDPLVLLGIVGFLYFNERKRCWLAGAALTLIAIKPHLVFLFWAAVIAWLIDRKHWQVLLGGTMAGALAIAIPLMFVPGILGDYVNLYSTTGAPKPRDWATPTLSTALDLYFEREFVWIRLIPTCVALIWFAFYWRKHRARWNWTEQTPLLLLVSQATTVFAWVWDQIVLLPALICGAVWALQGGPRRIIGAIVGGFILVNLGPLLVMTGILIPGGFWLFWMVPVFLLTYAMGTAQTHRKVSIA